MSLIPPMTPPDCNMQGYPRMMIDIGRLRGSAFDAGIDDSVWRAGFNLWFSAWMQTPAGSLADDDLELVKAAQLGRDLRTWKRIKSAALRGWVKCADGRLYHPVVCEVALERWLDKLAQRLSSGAGNAKRWGADFDPEAVKAEIATAAAMLRALNPKSEALTRKNVVAPGAVPSGQDRDPVGTGHLSRRDRKGREGNRRKVDPHGSNLPSDERARAALEGRASPVDARKAWSGPDEVWAAVVDHKGEEWTAGVFAAAEWRDLPVRSVVCRSGALEQEIKRSCTRLLSGFGVSIIREDAA